MALQFELSIGVKGGTLVTAAAGPSAAASGIGEIKELAQNDSGYNYGLFCQEITAVSALVAFDEWIEFKTATQTSNAKLFSIGGGQVQFSSKSAAGLEMVQYQGAVPSNLYSNWSLNGTSVTRIVNIALAG